MCARNQEDSILLLHDNSYGNHYQHPDIPNLFIS